MLHQAVLGSLERFLAILLEHHGDRRPERLSRKVAEAHAAGIQALLAIGRREAESGEVSLRLDGGAPETLTLAEAVERLRPDAFR